MLENREDIHGNEIQRMKFQSNSHVGEKNKINTHKERKQAGSRKKKIRFSKIYAQDIWSGRRRNSSR